MRIDVTIILVLTLFILIGVMAGVILCKKVGLKSNKPIKPEIEITCKGLECDTTYTYKAF